MTLSRSHPKTFVAFVKISHPPFANFKMLPTPCHLIIWPQKACRGWSHCSNTAVLKRRWAEACSQSNGLGKLADFDSEDTDWFVVEMTYYPFILRKTINKSVFTVLVVTTYLSFNYLFTTFCCSPYQNKNQAQKTVGFLELLWFQKDHLPVASWTSNSPTWTKYIAKYRWETPLLKRPLRWYIYICAIIYMR